MADTQQTAGTLLARTRVAQGIGMAAPWLAGNDMYFYTYKAFAMPLP